MVGVEAAAVAERAAFVPHYRIVGADAVDVAPEHVPRAVIFGDQLVAVVEELGGARASARGLEQAAERIVAEARRLAAAGRDEPVLGVEHEAGRAVGRQIAVGVVAEARGASGRVLVEAVDAVGAADVIGRVALLDAAKTYLNQKRGTSNIRP